MYISSIKNLKSEVKLIADTIIFILALLLLRCRYKHKNKQLNDTFNCINDECKIGMYFESSV